MTPSLLQLGNIDALEIGNRILLEIEFVGKFRPQLKELTSFKFKLLIRFIINKTC